MHESVSIRRKRLLHQSRYRGRLEGDLLLGGFAARHLASFSLAQLDRYEALMQESDQDLFAWISGQQPVPERHDHDVFRLLQDFGRGLLEAALACAAEVVRRLVQPEQRTGLLDQGGVLGEIVAGQIGKAELVVSADFP